MGKQKLRHLNPKQQQEQLNKILTLQRQNDIIAMLLDGKGTKEVCEYIAHKYGVSPVTVQNVYISRAREAIRQRKNYEVKELIMIHLARYEDIYHKLVMMKAQGLAMRALQAKEKLLGFHKEGFHMRVSKGQITSYQTSSVSAQYDPIRKLSPEKLARFNELLTKCKREPKQKKLTNESE
jgi:hypothetical protein